MFLSIIAFGNCNNEKDATKGIENISESVIKNEVINKSINGYEYIDLGLPSGLKWATCNIGANTPEEYGDYYAWGEITTTSKYSKENSKTYETKMDDINGNPNYDVARVNWGGSWRLPTKREMEELQNKCTWSWTTQSGVNGYRVTGPNGNSIFLPATGCYRNTFYNNVGEYGYYWTSTPIENGDLDAYVLCFHGGEGYVKWTYRIDNYPLGWAGYTMHTIHKNWDIYVNCRHRTLGHTIRPVMN